MTARVLSTRLGALWCLAAAAVAQGADTLPLLPVEPLDWRRAGSGLSVRQDDGLLRRVSWQIGGTDARPIDVPMVAPVRDLEAATFSDGGVLVLLAGGVRAQEGLVVYLVARDGQLHVFDTQGGSRLPSRFNAGLGSWPLVEKEGVVLFAYLRGGRTEFRAVDLRGQLHATRSYGADAPAVRGFRAESDAVTSEVRVFFDGDNQPLVFPHPMAPRLELSSTLLDFGSVTLRQTAELPVELRNTGSRPLLLEAEGRAGPFTWAGRRFIEVAPGASAGAAVRFHPREGGAVQQRLTLSSNAANARMVLVLRGEGRPAPSAAVEAPVEAAAAETAPPGPEVAPAPVAEEPRRVPRPPRVLALSVEPSGTGRVRVAGVLVGEEQRQVSYLRLRVNSGHRALATVAPGGGFAVELRAAAGDTIHGAAVGPTGLVSLERVVGRVLPALVVTDGLLEVRGPPGARFTLMSVIPAPAGDQIDLVLRAWSGLVGADGTGLVDPDQLGGPLTLVAVLASDGQAPRMTNLLRYQR